MVLNEILAKSNGIKLIDHSRNVSECSLKILHKTISNPSDKDIEIVKISGLLHDIGKITNSFQNKTLKGDKSDNKHRHNEVGWCFVYKYLKVSRDILEYILDSVHWHHGISNKLGLVNSDEINFTLSQDEIECMKEFVKEVLGKEYLVADPRDYPKTAPLYYNPEKEELDETNQYNIMYRTCLISSDRMISNLEATNSLSMVDDEINNFIHKTSGLTIECTPNLDDKRFDEQLAIANACKQTTIIKAATAFGKTLIGLQLAVQSDKKLIWVCPRNEVARAVYDSLIDLLEKLNLNISIELYYGRKTRKSNHECNKEFSSDIIVTNIDNFLLPSVDNRNADRLFLINTCNVIFDEYHELITTSPIFSCFINIMKIRHRITSAKTLLLSASYEPVQFMWDTNDNKTLVLPNVREHYVLPSDKKFKLRVIDGYPKIDTKNNLIIFNSISETQLNKIVLDCQEIVHTHLEEQKKDETIAKIIKDFGKYSEKNIDKYNVISSPVIQASLDISFDNSYESCLSAGGSVQRLGRVDRWDINENISTHTIFRYNSKAEKKAIEIQHSIKLRDLWFDFISDYDGQDMTRAEFYVIYNKYLVCNEKQIKDRIKMCRNTSMRDLIKIYPVHYYDKGYIDSDVVIAGGNKLRCSGNEMFITAKRTDSDGWCNPFSITEHYSFDKELGEDNNTIFKILEAMESIHKMGDDRFNYKEIVERKDSITKDEVRHFGKKSDSPYTIFNKEYDPTYGLISNKNLEKILSLEKQLVLLQNNN